MAKLYYIYQLYQKHKICSKYIGLNHYKRYFNFMDDIPDFDIIFKNYDIILEYPRIKRKGMKNQFCRYHICKTFDEILAIIKDIKPEYYETALKTSKERKIYFCNLFIMKTKDFLKYCKFVYDILFEFDKRNNFTSDDDILNYTMRIYKTRGMSLYQSRLEGFLAERLSNIFYYHHFKKIKSIGIVKYKKSFNKKSITNRKLIKVK